MGSFHYGMEGRPEAVFRVDIDAGVLPRQSAILQPDKAGEFRIAVLMVTTALRDSMMTFRVKSLSDIDRAQRMRILRRRKKRLAEKISARRWLRNPDRGELSLRACFAVIQEAWREHYNYVVSFEEFHNAVLNEPRRMLSVLHAWIDR